MSRFSATPRATMPLPTTRQVRFYLTAQAPCPYLPDRTERKVFAHLPIHEGSNVNDTLTQSGFRRSQGIAYRPACEACEACVSARIPTGAYVFSASERRVLDRNAGLTRHGVEAEATREQFDLLRRYLRARHPEGGMADMAWSDFVCMVEDTTVRTHILEYRTPSVDGGPGDLVAAALVDVMTDGLSLVYSFYDPTARRRSLGRYMILDHVAQAGAVGLPFVYLGYWVAGSRKMAYKGGFSPIELLRPGGWTAMTVEDRAAEAPPPVRLSPSPGLPVLRRRRTFGS